jgi:hypothetical protein
MMRILGGRFVAGRIVSWCLIAVLTAASRLALAAPDFTTAFFAAPQAGAGTDQSPATLLEQGSPAERTLNGTEINRYQLKLQKGQCALIYVEQRGMNVAVQLLGSGNEPVVEVDDEYGRQGTEKLLVVADNDGAYTVAVKPQVKIAKGPASFSPGSGLILTSNGKPAAGSRLRSPIGRRDNPWY